MIILKNKAFLLIEVLITVVVVTASIIFINHAFTSSVKAVSLSNSYHEAILFLNNSTFGLELDLDSENSRLSLLKEDELSDKGFLLKNRILPLTNHDTGDDYDQEDLEIERFTSSVTWQARGAERRINILTYVPITEDEKE